MHGSGETGRSRWVGLLPITDNKSTLQPFKKLANIIKVIIAQSIKCNLSIIPQYSWVWWYIPIIPTLGSVRSGNLKDR
jgi:hypothetical protein